MKRKQGLAPVVEFHVLTNGLGKLRGDRHFLVHFHPRTDVYLINGKNFKWEGNRSYSEKDSDCQVTMRKDKSKIIVFTFPTSDSNMLQHILQKCEGFLKITFTFKILIIDILISY